MSDDVVTTKKFQSWHLDGRGRIVGDWPLPEPLQPGQYVELGYAADGQLVRVREFVEGHAAPLVRLPHFDQGRLQHSDYEDPMAGIAGRNSYRYTPQGVLCGRQENGPKGALRFRVEISCDAQARIVSQRLFDHRDRFKERVDYRYDERGRHVEDRFFRDAEGQRPRGHVQRELDARGRVARQTWYDGAGQLLSAFSYAHDELDRVVEIRLERDGTTQLVTHKQYDAHGQRIEASIRDADGQVLSRETVDDGGRQRSQPALGAQAGGLTTRWDHVSGLAELAGLDPASLQDLVHVGYFYVQQGQLERARELFETLAALRHDDAYAALGVASTALLQQQPQTAINWYERALARQPDHPHALAGLAEAQLQLQRVDEALATYTRLFEVCPVGSDDAVLQRARVVLAGLVAAQPSAPQPR